MRELDVILVKYLEEHYSTASTDKQKTFRELLKIEDPLLFSLLMGNQKSSDNAQQALIDDLNNLFSL